jgi:hypothetical protein
MTKRWRSSVACPLWIVMLTLAPAAVQVAMAQPPPATSCVTYPSGAQWQTIVVRMVDGDCRIDPYESSTGIPLLRTFVGDRAFWDVCNLCGAPVDVRISESFPQSLSAIFERFSPPIDASESAVATSIPTGQHLVFSGDVTTGEGIGGTSNKYDIAVKFSTEGPTGWDEFDPELQIDDFDFAATLMWIGAGLAGLAVGFGAGYAFARRRARPGIGERSASAGASSA